MEGRWRSRDLGVGMLYLEDSRGVVWAEVRAFKLDKGKQSSETVCSIRRCRRIEKKAVEVYVREEEAALEQCHPPLEW